MGRLILFCVISAAVSGLTSGVDVLPDSVNATLGGTVRLNTTVTPTNTPLASIIWNFETVSIILNDYINPLYKDRITLSTLSGSLELRNLAFSDTGEYSFTVQPAGGSPEIGKTTLNIYVKIENVAVQPSDTTFEGSSVNLTCDASGSIITRDWMFNGKEIESDGNINFYDEKRVLSFRNLNRKDKGIYTCRISNPASSDSADYPMNVIYGAENVKIRGCESEVQVGTTLTLNCSADSEPTATFTWAQNGTTLVQSHEYVKKKVTLTDSGEYTCQAKNKITNKTSEESCTVTVTAIPPTPRGCSTGCIVGIVFGVIAVILIVAGVLFFVLKKKKLKAKSNTRTDGEGQDNSTYAQNQEVQYADVRFVKKGGVTMPGGAQNNTEYAEVRKNNRPPAARLPSYDAHMQRDRRPAPEPATLYADIRVK